MMLLSWGVWWAKVYDGLRCMIGWGAGRAGPPTQLQQTSQLNTDWIQDQTFQRNLPISAVFSSAAAASRLRCMMRWCMMGWGVWWAEVYVEVVYALLNVWLGSPTHRCLGLWAVWQEGVWEPLRVWTGRRGAWGHREINSLVCYMYERVHLLQCCAFLLYTGFRIQSWSVLEKE